MTFDEFEKETKRLLKGIPEEFHSAFYQVAWDERHAYGFEDVLTFLEDMIYCFRVPFVLFEFRIRNEK